MKTLMTIVMALSLSQAYGQASVPSQGTTPAANSTMPGTGSINNENQPTFGNRVRNTGTTTGSVRDSNTTTTTDSIGTTQSSTIRREVPTTPGTVTPSRTDGSGANCTDSSGRTFGSRDAGYNACINSIRPR